MLRYILNYLSPEGIELFEKDILPTDAEEVKVATGLTAGDALKFSLHQPESVNYICLHGEFNRALFVFGGTDMGSHVEMYLLATSNLRLPDMVTIRDTFKIGILRTILDLGKSARTEVIVRVWEKNNVHVRWCINAGFYPTGEVTYADNGDKFLEMIYTCVPQH